MKSEPRPLSGHSPWTNRRLQVAAGVLGPIIIALLFWELTAWLAMLVKEAPFPTPRQTLLRWIQMLFGEKFLGTTLYRHMADSLFRWAVGFGIASIAGLIFGAASGWWRLVEKLFMPIVYFLQLIPGLAWLPIAILFFGVSEQSTYFIIGVTAFIPVAVNVGDGVKRLDQGYIRAARMMGASTPSLWVHVLFPGVLPQFLSGLRLGLGNGWRVLVAAEMIVGTGTGLGYAILQSRWTLDYTAAFACILTICLVGLAAEHLFFRPLERLTVDRWGLLRSDG